MCHIVEDHASEWHFASMASMNNRRGEMEVLGPSRRDQTLSYMSVF